MLTDRRTFFVKEHVGLLKLTDHYDIFDPETNAPIGVAKEEASGLVKLLRLFVQKQLMPRRISVYETDNPKPLIQIRTGFAFLRPKVEVFDGNLQKIGSFQTKLFSLGGAFLVLDAAGNEVAMVKGDWKGWNFKFTSNSGQELGQVTKKWAGLGKELFTSADNYMIALAPESPTEAALLLLAAGLAVDMIYKER